MKIITDTPIQSSQTSAGLPFENQITIGTKVCWTEDELRKLINKVVDEKDKPTKKAGRCISFLTPNQRKNLKDKIKALQSITCHKYWEISFHKEPVEHTRLWHLDNVSEEWRYDSITGKFTSWQTEMFVFNKHYYIDDLLGEEE